VVQANIAEEIKWVKESWQPIIDKHISLSKMANYDRPDLIIWPETAFPDISMKNLL